MIHAVFHFHFYFLFPVAYELHFKVLVIVVVVSQLLSLLPFCLVVTVFTRAL